MSSEAFIEIKISQESWKSPRKILDGFLSLGWSLEDYEKKISYLPLGDKDDFNWQSMDLSHQEVVLEEVISKERAGEIIGVSLTWKDSLKGGLIHFFSSENRISFSLNANSPLKTDGVVDFDWFREKLFLAFEEANLNVDSVKFYQIDSGGQLEFEETI